MNRTQRFVALAVLASAGCREVNETPTEDAASLRERVRPGDAVALPAKRWMPGVAGLRWRTRFQTREAGGSAAKNDVDRVEDVRCTGPKLRDGRRMIGYLAVGPDGASTREEWYVDQPDGRFLREAGGGDDRLVFDPPFPVLPARTSAGATLRWTGLVRFRGEATPATGHARFRGFEPIATSEGMREAVCVETVLLAGASGSGGFRLPMTRWFLPEVGAVRVWFKSGGTEYLRETIAFRRR